MSEYRTPVEIWIKRLPENDGKKTGGIRERYFK